MSFSEFPSPPECKEGILYTVKPSDTLFGIAKEYCIMVQELINANPQVENPNLLFPGQKICLPVLDVPHQGTLVIITLDIGFNEFGTTTTWEASLYKGVLPDQETEGRFTEWKAASGNLVRFMLPNDVRKKGTPPFNIDDDTYVRIRTTDGYPEFDVLSQPFTLVRGKRIELPVAFISSPIISDLYV